MRLYPFFMMVFFFCWSVDAGAQETQDLASMPETWQLTLDVIKSKAQTLVVQNNGLQGQFRQLVEYAQKLVMAINEQQMKNQQQNDFLKERHGRTDQQERIDELTQIVRTKTLQARSYEEQWGNLSRKKSDLDNKIQHLKYTISDIQLHQQSEKDQAHVNPAPVQPQLDDQLVQLRKELNDETTQEVLLGNELQALKTGGKTQNLSVEAIEAENQQLEARLDVLRLQKLQHVNGSSDAELAQAHERMYNKLEKRKEELEANINAYEMRLDDLRESSLAALSWPIKRKQLVHAMVQLDARNNQMRNKISVLREDIDVLRDQVAKLERRIDFARGQGPN